jgi:N-ethylmaleimide reductase
VPNALNAEYYAQRAGAGLIITEGTTPSAAGRGYIDIPGLYAPAQVEAWRAVTSGVPRPRRRIAAADHAHRPHLPPRLPRWRHARRRPSAVQAPGEIFTKSGPRSPTACRAR